MPMLALIAEGEPLTEHLVLLIIAVALAGALLLIIAGYDFFGERQERPWGPRPRA